MTLLDEGKLKICLTPFDMVRYDLTCEKIDYDNTETRRALWEMFDEAKHKTGFDAANGRICIRVYPEKSGGCEIYITKIDENASLSDDTVGYTAKDTYSALNIRVAAVYGFPGLDQLLSACRCLSSAGYSGESHAYSDPFGGKLKYYLMINESAPRYSGKSSYKNDNMFMSEFGKRCVSENSKAFLDEHCELICEKNAVEILSKLC